MPRKRSIDEPPPEVATWFLTYSDVITLLMTFFILLLTFSTSEPEKFERMQVSMFGGGGSMGFAGKTDSPLDQEAVVMRQRPRSSRMTTRGSEMPPADADPSYHSLATGLAGLEESERRELATSHAIELPLSLFCTSDGKVTSLGKQRLRMMARQLRSDRCQLAIQVASDDDIPQGVVMAQHLSEQESVPIGNIGVGSLAPSESVEHTVRLVLTRRFGSR